MTIWGEIAGRTFEYFHRDIELEVLVGFEDLVRLWQSKWGDRAVPAWSDFDFCDFKGWHSRLGVYEIYYDPFDYACRISGTKVDQVFERSMVGIRGTELAESVMEDPSVMEFYEMICSQMLIARTIGGLNVKGLEHEQATFVEFPLSDNGTKATHTFEAFLVGRRSSPLR